MIKELVKREELRPAASGSKQAFLVIDMRTMDISECVRGLGFAKQRGQVFYSIKPALGISRAASAGHLEAVAMVMALVAG